MSTRRANVYIIAEQGGARKIGMSDDPIRRVISLQPGRAPLSVVATYPRDDAEMVERVAHRLLDEKRIANEWFDVTDEQAIAAVRQAIALVDSGVSMTEPKEVMNFRVPASFRYRMKRLAVERRMNLSDLMIGAVDAYGAEEFK